MRKTSQSRPGNSLRRAEQRLRYRWPIRFTTSPKQKQPFCGQLVDVSSRGIALLFHAGKNCPAPDQLVTAGFGVPYFDSHGSFDTVFFNRVGRVCRIDSLNGRVNRVAVQFAEPLFFKPGEQDISEEQAQQRLEAKARLASAERKSPAQAKRRANSQEEARSKMQAYAEQIAKVKAEAAQQIARVSAEAADAIARIEAGAAACGGKPGAADKEKNAGRPKDRGLLKKLDSFITDKSKVF